MLVTFKGLKTIAAITLFGIVAVAIFKHFVPYTIDRQQMENMAAAEKHLPLLRQVIGKDVRFTNVTAIVFSGDEGCLMIEGEVHTDRELEDLKQLVVSSKPPVHTLYQVDVMPLELHEEVQKKP